MNIRKIAHLDECPDFARLGHNFFAEARLPGEFDPIWFAHTWGQILGDGRGSMWIWETSEGIVGTIGGILAPELLTGDTIAMETFWYVDEKHRGSMNSVKLLFTFENWARDCHAVRIYMAHLEHQRLGNFYERRGYRKLETSYIKDVR